MNSDETRLTAQLVQSVEHGTLNPRVVGSSPMLGSCSTYWASLVGQLVKLLAMREACIRFLDWEDPLEKGQAIHSNILGLPW